MITTRNGEKGRLGRQGDTSTLVCCSLGILERICSSRSRALGRMSRASAPSAIAVTNRDTGKYAVSCTYAPPR
jgi:hypothetical protein